jgi:SAM-dependent methyltransferase
MDNAPTRADLDELRRLVSGYRVSQAIHAVATLGVADRLRDGPQDSDALAAVVGAHPDAFARVLRFLAGVGLFRETAPRRFALTPLGAGLRSDLPGSVRPMARMLLDRAEWASWGDLLHSVRTGETAFRHVHGLDLFAYLAAHPDDAARFDAAMTSNVARAGDALVKAYDFAGIERLVDVGGGHGFLLATVLRAHPTMQGVLFDRPEVVAGAAATLAGAGVGQRCEIVGGDFFADALPGGDAHVLRQVVHDWDDARATALLANCRRAMGPAGRLLVVERRIAPDPREALPELHLDLEMLVITGGRQRSDEEYRALFGAAGFAPGAVVPFDDPARFCVYEGRPI